MRFFLPLAYASHFVPDAPSPCPSRASSPAALVQHLIGLRPVDTLFFNQINQP
jgi:hypothetical protein